ncbi:hypothetical protein C4553_01325 [Candidatus Parcubacteria bacterium]|nr:MAG: hypothetical protein C4553_01325 [Candidatus Parcubacteria bacterium]
MKKALLLVVVVLLAAGLSFASQRQDAKVIDLAGVDVPPNAEVEKYPVFGGRLSERQEAELKLRPVYLEREFSGHNWHQSRRQFVFDVLPAGTMVLVDLAGVPRYKMDCGNRLVAWEQSCPKCPEPVPAAKTAGQEQSSKSFTDRLKDFISALWRFLGWLLALLAALALVGLLLWLFWQLIRRLLRAFRSNRGGGGVRTPLRPVAPTPVSSLAATPGQDSAAALPAEPASPATGEERKYGPTGPPSGPVVPQKRFFSFHAGSGGQDPDKVKFSGYRSVSVTIDESAGETTITARV